MSDSTTSEGLSAAERAAVKERAKETRGKKGSKADDEAAVREKIAAMADADRALAEKVHEVVMAAAPELTPRTYYGMPAYALNGQVLCFFQDAGKFKSRYATFGFNDGAQLDDGAMWPTSFALTGWTPAVEDQVRALVTKAVS